MALPLPCSVPSLSPVAESESARSSMAPRPPRGGWYWNSNRLARLWVPLIGPEGLGLLDLYLALANHRPGTAAIGWSAVTLTELTELTGWGRARLVRLNRLLVAAGLLEIRHQPVSGRGPAVCRSLYHVQRLAIEPTDKTLSQLAELATADSAFAIRWRRWLTNRARLGRENGEVTSPTVRELGPVPWQNSFKDRESNHDSPTTNARAHETYDPVPGHDSDPVTDQRQIHSTSAIKVQPRPQETSHLSPPIPGSIGSMAWGSPTQAVADREHDTAADDLSGSAGLRSKPIGTALEGWQLANGRPPNALERQRLTQLAALAEPGARATGETGWEWVRLAIDEAVEAGSAYVAPRRIARILERWSIEGRSATGRDTVHSSSMTTQTSYPNQCLPPAGWVATRRQRTMMPNQKHSDISQKPTWTPEPGKKTAKPQSTASSRLPSDRSPRHPDHSARGGPAEGAVTPCQAHPPSYRETIGTPHASRPRAECPPSPVADPPAPGDSREKTTWSPPVWLPGLAAPTATILRASLSEVGLDDSDHLRGAVIAGWSVDSRLLIATAAPIPPVVAHRLEPRLTAGLTRLIGRPVTAQLMSRSSIATPGHLLKDS